jgi:hypothetical protein
VKGVDSTAAFVSLSIRSWCCDSIVGVDRWSMRTANWCSADRGILSIRGIPNVLDHGLGRPLVESATFRISLHILTSALDGGQSHCSLVLAFRCLRSEPFRQAAFCATQAMTHLLVEALLRCFLVWRRWRYGGQNHRRRRSCCRGRHRNYGS